MLLLCYIRATMAIKSKPTGVRFDLEKIEFIKNREKLKSNQQVVDFLMNKYWWEVKVAVPTYKEVPPLNLKTETIVEQVTPAPKIISRKTPQEWVAEKREIPDGNMEMYQEWLAKLDASDLSTKVKTEIKFA